MKVFKFGGASVKDVGGIKNLAKIVKQFSREKLVVIISAMGKTTNALEEILRLCIANKSYENELNAMKRYHFSVMDSLFEKSDIIFNAVESVFTELDTALKSGLNHQSKEAFYDRIVSKGEILSTKINQRYLEKVGVTSVWIDARDFIITDNIFSEATVDWKQTKNKTTRTFPDIVKNKVIVTQGFIGGTQNGQTTTLGREGSDFSAAIFASCLDATSVTIWKDVAGILNADPKISSNAVKFEQLDYREAAEMTYYGATVIHPKTIKPLANQNIPLYVKSFENPHATGTEINEVHSHKPIPSFIYKFEQTLLSFGVKDFTFIDEKNLSLIFNAFSDLNIKINLMQSSAITVSICTNHDTEKIETLVSKLKNHFDIRYNTGLTLITVKNYFHDEPSIQQVCQGKKILLEQKSRHNFQVLVL